MNFFELISSGVIDFNLLPSDPFADPVFTIQTQFNWWFTGFLLCWVVSSLGSLVRLIKLAGGSQQEL